MVLWSILYLLLYDKMLPMETNTDKVRLQIAKSYFEDYKKNGKGILKALNLLLPEISDLKSKGIKNREQIAIFESMFDVKINYETYRQFVYSKLKKMPQKNTPEFVENSSPQNQKKTSISSNEMKQEKEVKKVAPKESKKNDDDFNLNETFERKTKPKFKGLL